MLVKEGKEGKMLISRNGIYVQFKKVFSKIKIILTYHKIERL